MTKIELGEMLLALYNARAFRTPEGMFPTFTEIIDTFGQFFDMNIGEPGDLARRIREKSARGDFLKGLSDRIRDGGV